MTAVTPGSAEMLALADTIERNAEVAAPLDEASCLLRNKRTIVAALRLAAKPAEDGVREAVEHIEMAQSRLRAALMGDEPCKPCIDLAASHLQEANKALSTTGAPKP